MAQEQSAAPIPVPLESPKIGPTAAPKPPRLATALLSASAITLSFGMAYALHLERPYWAGIAAMVLSQSAVGQSLQKGLWRMAGTVAGAVAGMAVLACFGEARLSLLLACGVMLSVLVMFMRGSSYSYFYYSTALMAVLSVAQSHGEAPFRMACARMEENLVGIAAYTLCALCLRPASASRELVSLGGMWRGVFDELLRLPADERVVEILRDKFLAGIQAFVALALITALWQVLAPAGTESALFIEIASLLVLLGFMTGRFAAWELLFSMAVGVLTALWLYCVVMPELDGFAALGAVIFALAFAMAWAFPAPEQGMARMGLLMPVFVLSGMGGFHFGPQGVMSGGVGLLCAALAVALVFTLAGRGDV